MQPSDLQHLAVPSDPQLHPDGARVAFVLTEIDLDDDRYVRTVHVWDGERTRRFTHGPSDASPRWSPDGRFLAFLRKGAEDGAKAQLHVMPADGGEAQRRTDLPLGVSDLAWSPDAHWLAVVGTSYLPELAELDDDERRRRPRRITRLPYRTDSQGWIHDRQDQVWVVEVSGDPAARCLTPDVRDASSPTWRPDGVAVAFLASPPDWPDTEPHTQAFEVGIAAATASATAAPATAAPATAAPADAAPATTPLSDPGYWSAVHYGPDGRVFLTGLADPLDWPGPHQIWVRTSDASDGRSGAHPDAAVGPAIGLASLTGHLDRDTMPGSPECATVGPRFVAGGFLTALEGRGTADVVHVGHDPATAAHDPTTAAHDTVPAVTEVVGGRRSVTGYAARDDGSAIAFTATDPATPGELYWREGGTERCVTDLARHVRSKVDLRPTVRFGFRRDEVELDAWAVLPPDFDAAPEGSVPVLVNVHGGPTAQYGDYFFDEFQVQAGAGYLVVGSNPHGSSGRGTDWARAVVGVWDRADSVDTLDLEAVADAVVDRFPQADAGRIGIMGGSYGGYAVARLLARTDRYASAVVERGLLQWESFAGTSDIGTYFDRMFLATSLLDGPDRHRAASPVGTAHRITTPTLIVHSDADWRCPPEQAEQLFAALKGARVPTEMLRFPDETHELSRSGTPKHRVERFEAILAWHDRHLRPSDATSPAAAPAHADGR